jgi:hypothetical protein
MRNEAQPQTTLDFDRYKGKNRLILLFAPAPDDAFSGGQKACFHESQAALSDRDIVVLEFVRGRDKSDAWERFEVPQDVFHCLLVGKDGSVKLRRTSVVEPEELFSLIDAMPMRQQEMQRKRTDQTP